MVSNGLSWNAACCTTAAKRSVSVEMRRIRAFAPNVPLRSGLAPDAALFSASTPSSESASFATLDRAPETSLRLVFEGLLTPLFAAGSALASASAGRGVGGKRAQVG